MRKINFLNFTFNCLIILLLIITKIKSEEDIYKFDFNYLVSFILINENIIISSNDGFYTFNSNFMSLYNYTFPTSLTLDNKKYEYPSFTQFSEEEGGYVICYLLKNIYIFNKNGEFIYLIDANETSIVKDETNNYRINAYKKENLEYYYSIITFDYSVHYGMFYMFYYKINLSNYNKELLFYNTHSNYSEKIGGQNTICCEKMITNNKDNYITCFYQYEKQSIKVIGELSFQPDKNFTYIEPRKYLELNCQNKIVEFASSTINDDKTKAYICYSAHSQKSTCFYYDINTREFSNIYVIGYQCTKSLYLFNLYYFRKTKEFIFSCVDSTSIYSIIKFKENISLIQPNISGIYNIENCNSVNSFSILYYSINNEYIMYSLSTCSPSYIFKLYKNNLTYFFNTTNAKDIVTDSLLNTYEISESNLITTFIEKNIKTVITDSNNITIERCNDDTKIIEDEGNCVCNNAKGYYSLIYNNIVDDKCYNKKTIIH